MFKRKLTASDYHDLAKSRGIEWIEESVIPKSKQKTSWRCKNGHTWDAAHNNIKIGPGDCPYCRDTGRLTVSHYNSFSVYRGIHWVGNPKGRLPKAHAKTDWECNLGHKWKATYSNVNRGSGCPTCSAEKVGSDNRLKTDDYKSVATANEIQWIGKKIPKQSRQKTEWSCNVCNHKWKATYDTIKLSGCCPNCFGSAPVQLISNCLTRLGIFFEMEKGFPDLRDKNPLRFDFYIPSHNMLIEYHGDQHFRPIRKWGGKKGFAARQRRDGIKRDWAAKNGFFLLEISHSDRKNIPDILQGYFT